MNSLRNVMTLILTCCQHVALYVNDENSIPGWVDHLLRATQMNFSVKSLAVHQPLFERLLTKSHEAVANNTPGRDTPLREISCSIPFDSYVGLSNETLRPFQVNAGTSYEDFCPQLF